MKTKWIRGFFVSSILAAGIPLPAQALAPPTPPEPVDSTPFQVDGFCSFPLLVQFSGKSKTISLPGGRTLVTSPALNVSLTNVDDPTRQVTLNITGTLLTSEQADGNFLTVARGRNLLGDPVAGLVLAVGHFSFVNAADGVTNVVRLSGTGTLTNVCTLLD
jgi:hypothetical protein